jgi:hypothetical protein
MTTSRYKWSLILMRDGAPDVQAYLTENEDPVGGARELLEREAWLAEAGYFVVCAVREPAEIRIRNDAHCNDPTALL